MNQEISSDAMRAAAKQFYNLKDEDIVAVLGNPYLKSVTPNQKFQAVAALTNKATYCKGSMKVTVPGGRAYSSNTQDISIPHSELLACLAVKRNKLANRFGGIAIMIMAPIVAIGCGMFAYRAFKADEIIAFIFWFIATLGGTAFLIGRGGSLYMLGNSSDLVIESPACKVTLSIVGTNHHQIEHFAAQVTKEAKRLT